MKNLIKENWLIPRDKVFFYRNFYLETFDSNFISPKLKISTVINLKNSSEEILKGFRSNYRNEIKKCSGNSIFEKIDSKNVINIENEYNYFAKNKKITPLNKFRLLKNSCYHCFININDNERVSNIYLTKENYTFLLYSYTVGNPSKESSQAQKKLHFQSMMFFKSNEFEFYDFGGISLNKKLSGINKFKLGFGGKRSAYFFGFSSRIKFSRLLRNLLIDLKHPSMYLRGTIKSKIINQHDTANTDYEVLFKICKVFPIENWKYFYDIGCGKGAVFSFLKYLKLTEKLEYIGFEINQNVYSKYLRKTPNIFYNQDVFTFKNYKPGIFYLFNPFPIRLIKDFIKLIPKNSVLILFNTGELENPRLKLINNFYFKNKEIKIYEVFS